MDQAVATYELRDYLIIIKAGLINKINKYTFSMNMGECKSNRNKVSFPVLASSFDEVKGKSVVELHESIDILLSV